VSAPRAVRARWVLPVAGAPVANGWVATARGRIVEVGSGRAPDDAEDLGDVALLPGLVNAHTHLELSWMRGRIPPAASMIEWVRDVLDLRDAGPAGGDDERVEAMSRAAVEMHSSGTVLVGDVSNQLSSVPVLRQIGLPGVVFHELLGFNVADAHTQVRDAWTRVAQAAGERSDRSPQLVFSVIAHAPYSTAPSLFRAIAQGWRQTPLSVHLAESAEEIEFLQTGRGEFRTLLKERGVWNPSWEAPNCDPVEYLHRLGYLQSGLLAVHAVHVTDPGLERLRRAGAVVVTCPRSNEWVGGGIPRIAHFYAARVPVAVGTDSLASTPTLNMFDELATMRRLAPDVTAASFLDSATRVGAVALGRGREYGTLEAGKRAVFVAVALPGAVRDVEEYLVSGVPASDVRVLTR
jgi:aminodeoxyfutalosine deaminase